MKLSTILICSLILALAGCDDVNDMTQEVQFTQHKTTGLCFAVYTPGEGMAMANVPCTPEVLAIINGQATAPPVVATETVR